MPKVFTAIPKDERRGQLAAYRQYLHERDGVLDLDRLTLPRREARMAQFTKPLARVREIDRSLFDRHCARFDAGLDTSPELLLLLSLVKVNAAEAYGVTRSMEGARRQVTEHGDDLELHVLIEESYHTRILLSTACLYGLNVTAPYEPPAT